MASAAAASSLLPRALASTGRHGCQESLPLRSSSFTPLPARAFSRSAKFLGLSGARPIGRFADIVALKSTKAENDVEESPLADNEAASSHFPAGQFSAATAFFLLQSLVVSLPAEAFEFPSIAFWNSKEVESIFYVILIALFYVFVAPPVVFNYLRARWFKRNMWETIFQYFCFFLFFPSMLLWAPFINFRPIPPDPSQK